VSRGREATKRGSEKTDKGRRGMAETKRSRRCFPSGSRSTGNYHTGAAKELAEEDKSRTIGISSV